MADKDTREDDGTHGEVPMLPEDGRSAGRQAVRSDGLPDDVTGPPSDGVSRADGTATRPQAAEPVPPDDPAAEQRGPDDSPGGIEPGPGSEIERTVADFDAEHADLVEPLADKGEVSAPAPETSEDAAEAASSHVTQTDTDTTASPKSDVEPVEADPDSWRDAIADVLAEPSEPSLEDVASADGQPKDADDAAFTSAAADLFRPAEITEEPHLTTIGRRIDPKLRIPRPEVPEISPRLQPDAVSTPAAKPWFWTRFAAWWRLASWRQRARGVARYAAYVAGGYFALVLVLIVLFRFVNPPGSMLMLTQFLTGTSIDRRWVPLSSISRNLVRAVVVSEDGRFCEHSGIDTAAIREAIDRAQRGAPRGASTISMQVTKNLFLWNAKSYVRKVIEIPLTLIMELVWPKSRILEVYLNIAEWAPGVFGAEAAAQHHFKKPASRLTARESALLAAVLPNPIVRNASAPNRQTSAKARVVQSRVKAYGAIATCVVSRAAEAPAEPAAVRRPTIRKASPSKSPAKQPQRKKAAPPQDDWNPMLNFGR